jgi:hypothetical protein
LSDRLTGRLISPLARASARKRASAADETRRETTTQRHLSRAGRPSRRQRQGGGDTARKVFCDSWAADSPGPARRKYPRPSLILPVRLATYKPYNSTASIRSSKVRGSQVARSMSGTISALHSPRRSQDLHPFRPHHPVAIDPVAQLDALTLECRDGVLGYLPAYARHPGAQVDKLVASYRSRRVDSRASKNHLSWPGPG